VALKYFPKAKLVEGLIRRYISEILFKINKQRISEAENLLKDAIKADKANGMLFQLARDYLAYSNILKQVGKDSQAYKNHQMALDIFEKCSAEGWVGKYKSRNSIIENVYLILYPNIQKVWNSHFSIGNLVINRVYPLIPNFMTWKAY